MVGAIVGIGKIGLRHLQGTINSRCVKRIYLFDPDNSYRKEAIKLDNNSNTELIFLNLLADLPLKLDLLIVGTSANVRLDVLQNVLSGHQVHNVLLEKIVFNDLRHFSKFKKLTKSHKIDVRVNLGKRYDGLTSFLKSSKKMSRNITMNVVGGNWGLLCNAIHFIDLVGFVSNRKLVRIEPNLSAPFLSKRQGFYEANGSIKCFFEEDTELNMISMKSEAPISIEVSNQKSTFSWDECSQKVQGEKRGLTNCLHAPARFQSDITKDHVRQVSDGSYILLPRLDEVEDYHKNIIRCLIPYFKQNQIRGCPIT